VIVKQKKPKNFSVYVKMDRKIGNPIFLINVRLWTLFMMELSLLKHLTPTYL